MKFLTLVYVLFFLSPSFGAIRDSIPKPKKEESTIGPISETTTVRVYKPIISNIGYSHYWSKSASWSYWDETKHQSDYFLLDYTTYASTFQEFRQRYPTVTITTRGEAKSPETFGNKGYGKFGTFTYDTNYFMAKADYEPYYVGLVTDAFAHKYAVHKVLADIRIGFMRKGTKLYLRPFVWGKVVGHGAWSKSVSVGLYVGTATFNPK